MFCILSRRDAGREAVRAHKNVAEYRQTMDHLSVAKARSSGPAVDDAIAIAGRRLAAQLTERSHGATWSWPLEGGAERWLNEARRTDAEWAG